MFVVNIIMTLAIAAGCSLLFFVSYLWYSISVAFLLIISVVVLLYSVHQIKKVIKHIKHAFPDEQLMLLHFINFTAYAILRISKHTVGVLVEILKSQGYNF